MKFGEFLTCYVAKRRWTFLFRGLKMTAVVAGMAEAVESRRRALGVDLPTFRSETGLTGQALLNIRKGLHRQYAETTVLAVGRVLKWAPDWYDRLLAGELPVEQEVSSPSGVDEVAELRDRVAQLTEMVTQLATTVATMGAEVAQLRDRQHRPATGTG